VSVEMVAGAPIAYAVWSVWLSATGVAPVT
jgi:hypothetical protein